MATLLVALVLGILSALSIGFAYTLHLRAAHAETEKERQQAGRSYRKAIEAVEQMLVHMGAGRIEAIPGTQQAKWTLLRAPFACIRIFWTSRNSLTRIYMHAWVSRSSYLGDRQMARGRSRSREQLPQRPGLLDQLPAEPARHAVCQYQSAYARYVLGKILSDKNQRTEAKRLYTEASQHPDREGRRRAA